MFKLISEVHAEKSFRNLMKIKLKSDCIYHATIDLWTSVCFKVHQTDVHFPIDLESKGRPFVSKSIGKW